MSTAQHAALKSQTIWIYALMGLPLAIVGYPIGIYLPSLYTEAGLTLGMIGGLLMAARISDAITDPIMGFASDRVRTRFGRRKPWIALGVPLCADQAGGFGVSLSRSQTRR